MEYATQGKMAGGYAGDGPATQSSPTPRLPIILEQMEKHIIEGLQLASQLEERLRPILRSDGNLAASPKDVSDNSPKVVDILSRQIAGIQALNGRLMSLICCLEV